MSRLDQLASIQYNKSLEEKKLNDVKNELNKELKKLEIK